MNSMNEYKVEQLNGVTARFAALWHDINLTRILIPAEVLLLPEGSTGNKGMSARVLGNVIQEKERAGRNEKRSCICASLARTSQNLH